MIGGLPSAAGGLGNGLAEQLHRLGRQHVHAEEAEVMPGPQSGHDQLLLGAGGRGLFQHPLDAIQTAAAGDGRAADGPVVAEHALAGGLHGGDRTVFRPGRLDQLLRASPRLPADVEVVAHQVQEGLPADQRGRAMQGLAIAAGLGCSTKTSSRE